MKTIQDIDIQEKTVLLRADYNAPLEEGKLTNDYRLLQSLPTLEYLLQHNCRIIIISHLGRPDGEVQPELSLQPVAKRLQELLGTEVVLASDIESVDAAGHQITLLENLRFWPEEESNDDDFARRLAALGDVFAQDGFGVVHRSHASTEAVTRHMPSVAGLLLTKETKIITEAMDSPRRPLVAIFGGAKISDKIHVLEQFIDRADRILIGGAMANTFFNYEGLEVGKSNYESDQEDVIDSLLHKIAHKEGLKEEHRCEECQGRQATTETLYVQSTLELPSDVAVAKAVEEKEQRVVVDKHDVSSDEYILDIGPDTIARFQEVIANAGTVIWNGPLGLTELPNFAYGSNSVAATLKEHKDDITSVIGGGDTAGFVMQWDSDAGASFTHVSTGGGAALDFMAGQELPGIAALDT